MKIKQWMKVQAKDPKHPLAGQVLLVTDILGSFVVVKLSKKTKPYVNYQFEKVPLEWIEKECQEVE